MNVRRSAVLVNPLPFGQPLKSPFWILNERRVIAQIDGRLMRSVVEKLLARDLVLLDRVNADFFESDALAGGFGGDVRA